MSPSERRLIRLAYDLHDGPLQDVAALAADLRVLQTELGAVVPDGHADRLRGTFDDLTARLTELNTNLRELAQSLEPKSIVDQDLRASLVHEVDKVRRRSALQVQLDVQGALDDLTRSQRITILRVVQESLTNIRDHSCATQATVTITESPTHVHVVVSDDGSGFDVRRAIRRAAKRGRLGLTGMKDRVALVGGEFDMTSERGRGTTTTVVLERWQPPAFA